MNTLDEHEWHRLEQAHVLANVQQAFSDAASGGDLGSEDEDMYVSGGGGTGGELMSPTATTSAAAQSDAHALALMLQQQLDAINNEIRYARTDSCLLSLSLSNVCSSSWMQSTTRLGIRYSLADSSLFSLLTNDHC